MKHIVKVNDLLVRFDYFELGSINIKLEPGYIMGLIGPNGAGKTTLLQTLLGLYNPTEGNIHICGYDRILQGKEAKSHMGFVLDNSVFRSQLSAKDNGRLFGSFYPSWNQTIFSNYCNKFGVNLKKPLKRLSKGTVTKFQLAFALSHDADLILLDEPSAGLDPVFRRELIEIMEDVIADGEKSIIYSTHLTEELDQIADYITLLVKGKQIFSLSKEELMDRYCILKGTDEQIKNIDQTKVIGKRFGESYSEALVLKNEKEQYNELQYFQPSIEDILCYTVNRE